MLLAILLLAWLLTKAIQDGHVDHEYAKQGLVSPRLEAKYGTKVKARSATARYGFTDHVLDAVSDYWQRRTDALIAARDAKAVNPGERVRLRDRLAAAGKAVTQTSVYRRLVDPAGVGSRPAAETAPAVEAPDVGTRRLDDDGWKQWTGTEWAPVPPVAGWRRDTDCEVVEPATPAENIEPTKVQTEPVVSQPAQPTPNGGTPMSAPTGEAVNYETTVAELNAMIDAMQLQVDSAAAALASIAQTKASIDAMQQNYQVTATAAATKLDHETGLHLDGTTLGHAGTTVDALPPNAVDGLLDELEAMEAQVKERHEQAETALASLDAELKHVVETYGDAHANVAGNLGGDSRFLDSGGGGSNVVTDTIHGGPTMYEEFTNTGRAAPKTESTPVRV